MNGAGSWIKAVQLGGASVGAESVGERRTEEKYVDGRIALHWGS